MTVADRAAAVLMLLAGAFGAALLARHGHGGVAWLPPLVGAGVVASRALGWTRSRARAHWRLGWRPDAALVLEVVGQGAVPAQLGPGTRLLGPSVFIDVRFAIAGRQQVYRRWLTPLDVPAEALRRWSVVLPGTGRVACS